jgi:hypothetical protein
LIHALITTQSVFSSDERFHLSPSSRFDATVSTNAAFFTISAPKVSVENPDGQYEDNQFILVLHQRMTPNGQSPISGVGRTAGRVKPLLIQLKFFNDRPR